MLPRALFALTLALGAFAASSGTNGANASGASGTNGGGNAGASSGSGSSGIGTPTNSAQLPSLSGVSSCVTDCLETAAGAAGCESEVAVNCFCATPKNYTTAFLGCLTTCPSEVASAEALVEQFCAAASTPTSLSFASFTPSSTPVSSASTSSASKSGSTSGGSSATSPPSSPSASSSASTPPNTGSAAKTRLPLAAIFTSAASVLLGALVVL
ncbi:hypothetical protein C8F04DRAFT_1131001 [Mycena alexandri]|uniref:Extracellular membrane protein CFEM domain-containing protein n=1 Tax=Mycena alexandri TaxID=1745969 RepID=A0AAD6SBW5_9AGAR|nr:hypothetical protein C8F04DRAFT_1131001 [Mycena alexandri]